MKILSLKPGHDGQIALLENGHLAFSIEAEKDSWPRYETVTPDLFVRSAGLTSDIPDVVALSGWVKGFHSVSAPTAGGYFGCGTDTISVTKQKFFGKELSVFASSHERSHIFCSFGLSPIANGTPFYALIWEGNIGSFYRVDEHFNIVRLGDVLNDPGNKYAYLYALADPKFPDGLGNFRFEDAGKLMALASYGTSGATDVAEQKVIDKILSQNSILLTLNKAEFRDSIYYNIGVEDDRFKQLARRHSDAIFARFFDFARSNMTEGLPLVIGGGCGLNCDWNTDWQNSGLFESVFVPPCTNDSGSAIGTAIDAQYYFTGNAKISWSVYTGEDFISDIDDPTDATVEEYDAERVAGLLAQGNVFAWVQGRYEIGPRALGNRSLLAMPFTQEMHARLNRIKEREGFRPIAPICMDEEMDRLFDGPNPSPFMLHFQRLKTDQLPAITHVDGTARAQSVSKSDNQEIYQLLSAFKKKTGFGVLCNTSLNFKGTGFINRLSDLHKYAVERNLDGYVVGKKLYLLK